MKKNKDVVKDNSKRNEIILWVATILLPLIYFVLAKMLFVVKQIVCIDPSFVGKCYQVAPHQWGFWIMSVITFFIVSEIIFLATRLNEWNDEDTTISQSKVYSLWFSLPITAFLVLLSGVIISSPVKDTLMVIGCIILVIAIVVVAGFIAYYLGDAIKWVFGKLVKLNEWILNKMK